MTREWYENKLSALKEAARRGLPHPLEGFIPVKPFETLFASFNRLREQIALDFPSLFDYLPTDQRPNVFFTEHTECVERESVEALINAAAYAIDLLETEATDPTKPEVGREGIFFQGQPFDALRQLTKIIATAKHSITLIDAYIDETVLDLLSSKAAGVQVQLLTKELKPAVKVAATAFKAQYGALSVQGSRGIHDRFLIVDDVDFYHLGPSVKDAGRRGGMFSRVEEPTIMDGIRTLLLGEWQKGATIL